MQSAATLFSSPNWLWEEPIKGIWTLIVCGIASFIARRLWRFALALGANVRQRTFAGNAGIRGIFRALALRDLRWLRRHRLDEVWISREVSRGHTSQLIFILWFGLWLLAMGMKESLFVSAGSLIKAPEVAILAVLPMYFFEIAWIRSSGRAAKLINYRKKVRIWRWDKR
ncbi:hypothetical protein [Pseudomonas oryzihabitans]|uniref:Uncharacterized protein n=1 Tax=Pseudomonas oryzihabitans TaxID=47885 RepID=A0ABX3ISJ3_9PSED|nr:hypothetical protein [Pseudomonas psychrotolerans]ONN70650.1 hypothetical protein BVL52_20665 [Pseudomonas psychrotolerans]